jgi:pilus assembly protein CpaB
VRRSNRLVILVGVLLAVLAFVGIVVLLNQGGGPTGPEEDPRETVLVATEDIALGDPVTPELVEEQLVDPEAVVPTPLRSTSQVNGQPALFAIQAGAQVTAEAVGLGEGQIIDLSARLEPGEKAIAIQVDRVTGMDFLVTPGDHIDIVMSQNITVLQETADSVANTDPNAPPRFETVQGLDNQRTVKAVLQNKRVLYVSASRARPVQAPTEEGEEQPTEAPPEIDTVVIVIAGTDQDAEVIKFAQNDLGEIGSLTALIRSTADDELAPDAEEDTLGITIDQLVDVYGLRIPGIVEQLAEEATPQ